MCYLKLVTVDSQSSWPLGSESRFLHHSEAKSSAQTLQIGSVSCSSPILFLPPALVPLLPPLRPPRLLLLLPLTSIHLLLALHLLPLFGYFENQKRFHHRGDVHFCFRFHWTQFCLS